MVANTLGKGYNRRRLVLLLVLLFAALSIPTAFLVRHAFDQLKWESFYQYRVQAEALTDRIGAELNRRLAAAESRSFEAYSFLQADAPANVAQRSPLSAYPVLDDFPGVVGYFQVDSAGVFSTPLLPATEQEAQAAGIGAAEWQQRLELAENLRAILAENALVRDTAHGGRASGATVSNDIPDETDRAEERLEAIREPESAAGDVALSPQSPVTVGFGAADSSYTQQVFDRLVGANEAPAPTDSASVGSEPARRQNVYGRVDELKLDDALQKETEDFVRQRRATAADSKAEGADFDAPAEEQALSAPPASAEPPLPPAVAGVRSAAITAFAGTVDGFDFSMLDSGHFVLFRDVWRADERYVQGLLLEPGEFTTQTIESAYYATTLPSMSTLVLGFGDDIIAVIGDAAGESTSNNVGEMGGSLLHRASLAAPFDRLQLIFSITTLPPGPGATVLVWTSVAIALTFLVGFIALYRLGIGQLRLARQQQDFVSAVSHELKTPLTSIRMYGEMLKEGWVEESRRRQYYEYIHDEAERLTRLISNVLQLARISREEPVCSTRPVSVGELLDQVRSKIASQVERAGFELDFDCDDVVQGAEVSVDDDCFAQIVINLVDNAIKFSRDAERKAIEITARLTSDGNVEFTVRDYGPGIPKDQLTKIFRLFYRSESELTRETVGTGIGLAIVHQLMLAMNGTVDVLNTDPGASFRLVFPADRRS